MPERWRVCPTPRDNDAIVRAAARRRVGEIADRQWGRVHLTQLIGAGASRSTISRWITDGYLRAVYPRVYAVGHTSGSIEADLAAALLYAGPGAMLSHETAAWWWGLTDREPVHIDVSTSRRFDSLPRRGSQRALRVHSRRQIPRVSHRRLPVTPIAQTLLDFASVASLRRVRHALAQAEYRRLLDVATIDGVLGRGRPWTDLLRRALANHRPELAHTRSEFERRFIELCERGGLPIPELNATVCGLEVDALWRGRRVIVELDGRGNHGTAAQITRDHERDLRLRAAGYLVLRYSWRQLMYCRELVLADLRRALGLR